MKHLKRLPLHIIFILGLLLAGGLTTAAAFSADSTIPVLRRPPSHPVSCTRGRGEEAPISTTKLIIEFQSTDGDLGVHGQFDDSGWSELCIFSPSGKQILGVRPQAELKNLTMASLFFESREPLLEEFSFADLMANFPEGEYQVRALSFDGTVLAGAATFSHDVPAPPIITAPELAEDAETVEEAIVSAADLVIEWEDVTETVDGRSLTLTGYEVIITQEEFEDPNGFSRPIFDVNVPADRNSLSIPAEFLEPDTVYELEVLALEESGNQTIAVGFFQTDSPEPSGETLEFGDANVLIEFNATAGDLGFHAEVGAEPWQHVQIFAPDGSRVFNVHDDGSVGEQGLSSVSFESAEPPLDELPLNEFLARFPEGEYIFIGETVEGDILQGTGEFTHIIPDAPIVTSPAEGEVVDRDSVVITWEPVTTPADVEIEVYQLQIFPSDPPAGQDPIDLNIDFLYEVPASINEVKIPGKFLESGVEYSFELLAIESGGNRTITVGTFVTAETAP